MKERMKNLITLFAICLVLIPSFIYGATMRVSRQQAPVNESSRILKKITVSSKEVNVPEGADEQEFRSMIEVKAYYKGIKEPQVVTNYTTNYAQLKEIKGTKAITIKCTENNCTKQTKVYVTFCKPFKPEVTPTPTSTPLTKPIPPTGTSVNTEINFPYISGYPDGTFRPNQAVTREEFATMIARLLTQNDVSSEKNQYKDLPDLRFSTDAINYLTNLGIFTPDQGGNFNPNAPVTKEVAREILTKLEPYVKDKTVTVPTGSGDLTRTEAVVLLNKLFNVSCKDAPTTSDFSDVTTSTPYYKDIICATQPKTAPRTSR